MSIHANGCALFLLRIIGIDGVGRAASIEPWRTRPDCPAMLPAPTTGYKSIADLLPPGELQFTMRTKRYLVIVRAGDRSLHPGWTQSPATRNWDLLVSYFGADDNE